MVVYRGAEMSCARRPEWWQWTVWVDGLDGRRDHAGPLRNSTRMSGWQLMIDAGHEQRTRRQSRVISTALLDRLQAQATANAILRYGFHPGLDVHRDAARYRWESFRQDELARLIRMAGFRVEVGRATPATIARSISGPPRPRARTHRGGSSRGRSTSRVTPRMWARKSRA